MVLFVFGLHYLMPMVVNQNGEFVSLRPHTAQHLLILIILSRVPLPELMQWRTQRILLIIGVCFPKCLREKVSGLTFTPTRKQEMSHYKILNGRSVLLDYWLYFVTRSHETSHRQAKQFKRVVYITFSEYSVDLKLVDDGSSVSEISQNCDTDIRSEMAWEDSRPNVKVFLPLTCVCHD